LPFFALCRLGSLVRRQNTVLAFPKVKQARINKKRMIM
jgi:hypothetical protein